MLESKFQAGLIKEIKNRFPGSVVLKNDPNYIQGMPDLLVLWKNKWAALECKQSAKASKRPNQEYWVEKLRDMSYASFIFPENKERVLDELEHAFKPKRRSRVSRSK